MQIHKSYPVISENIIQFGHRQRRVSVVSWIHTGQKAEFLNRKDVFPMRLRSEADIQEFLDAVNACEGEVYLKSPEGDIFNLKSSMSRYVAIGRLIEEQGDTLELFANRKEDQARLMPLVEDLMAPADK